MSVVVDRGVRAPPVGSDRGRKEQKINLNILTFFMCVDMNSYCFSSNRIFYFCSLFIWCPMLLPVTHTLSFHFIHSRQNTEEPLLLLLLCTGLCWSTKMKLINHWLLIMTTRISPQTDVQFPNCNRKWVTESVRVSVSQCTSVWVSQCESMRVSVSQSVRVS